MKRIPQLGSDPDLVAGNVLESFANFFFVLVDVGTVKVTVSKGKGLLDNRLDDIGFRAPFSRDGPLVSLHSF